MTKQNKNLVIYGTPTTEIYRNKAGGICISQENEFNCTSFVYFSANEAESIIKAIKNIVKEIKSEV